MGNIHVSGSLDQDQRIFRYISFYDLIDLLTFSQISFTRSDPMHYRVPFQADEKRRSLSGAKPARAQAGVARKASAIASIAHQSWALLDEEEQIDWDAPDMSQPRICVVSSIRALSESLFTDAATNVFIERTYRTIQGPTSSELIPTVAVPMFQDDTVSVIVSSTDDAASENRQRNALRLLVDLKTLLAGVIISPDASVRFLELASKLVQQTTYAFVSRARRPVEQCCVRGYCSHGQMELVGS